MYEAKTIAKWFLAWAEVEEANDDLSNLKLQKLLYYAQGHYLANFGERLFGDELQAWSHGPVVPSVYREYRDQGAQSLAISDDEFDWGDVDSVTTDFLIELWDRYGSLAPWRLRDMTHAESPWQESWRPGERFCVITIDSMRRFFGQRVIR